MTAFKTRDGLLQVEVSEMDVVAAVDFSNNDPPPEPADHIIVKVRSPNTDTFHLALEFDPQVAIDLGKEIMRQGRSAKND